MVDEILNIDFMIREFDICVKTIIVSPRSHGGSSNGYYDEHPTMVGGLISKS